MYLLIVILFICLVVSSMYKEGYDNGTDTILMLSILNDDNYTNDQKIFLIQNIGMQQIMYKNILNDRTINSDEKINKLNMLLTFS